MISRTAVLQLAALSITLCSLEAFAHSPLFDCFDNGDGTASCEGAFSDGSSASGVGIRVELASGRVILQGELDAASSYSFDIPDAEYAVFFEAGEGHEIVLFGDEIY